MKNLTLYKPNGDSFKDYKDILGYELESGTLSFRWERKPGNQTTMEKVVTNLPFFLEDDMEP
jgi:hypothetical protein